MIWCFISFQKLITSHPHAVNCRDLDGRHSTPLHFAAGYNRVAVVEYLLQHGADVHAKDKGYSVLFILKFSSQHPLRFKYWLLCFHKIRLHYKPIFSKFLLTHVENI